MCLYSKANITLPNKPKWKVGVKLKGKIYPFFRRCFSKPFELNKWINEKDYRHNDGRNSIACEYGRGVGSYSCGFHCFVYKKDAIRLREEEGEGTLLKVYCRKIVTTGYGFGKAETIVAKQIFLVEEK
ncbi:MAG: hypothetical protein KAU20_05745 [Nanoarchaeota archaeon]|nr:hypothetical protein [Nanoarchaeota archaeon]